MTATLLAPPASLAGPALMRENQETVPFQDALSYALSRSLTADLRLSPYNIVLHVHDGKIRAAGGHTPVGQILVREGWCTQSTLERALQSPGRIVQNLMDLGVKAIYMRNALKIQAQEALAYVLAQPPAHYELHTATPLPSPGAGLSASEVMEMMLTKQDRLPINNIYQLAAPKMPVALESHEIELLRWINGRRTLKRAMDLTGLPETEQNSAAHRLLTAGLLEPSVVFGLRLIVPKPRPADQLTQPPASLKANLFVRRVNGQDDVASIARNLRISEQEACTILTGLYRDRVIEIASGEQEFLRLLEEF